MSNQISNVCIFHLPKLSFIQIFYVFYNISLYVSELNEDSHNNIDVAVGMQFHTVFSFYYWASISNLTVQRRRIRTLFQLSWFIFCDW